VSGPGEAIEPRVPQNGVRFDELEEIVAAERLDDEVIGAQRPRPVHVRLVRFRGHDDEERARELRARPHLLDDLEAVHAVHDDVADDHVGPAEVGQGHAGVSVDRGVDDVAVLLEEEGQQVDDLAVVVDDQHRTAHGWHPSADMMTGGKRAGVMPNPPRRPSRPNHAEIGDFELSA